MSHDQTTEQEREDVLAQELSLLAHDPAAPQSTVDIARAVHTARGRLRRRRARRSGVAVVLAAAVALGATLLPGIHSGPVQRHGSSRTSDPLVATVRFTWLPPGFTVTRSSLTDGLYRAEATAARPVPGTLWAPAGADVYVYPKGVDPAVRGAVLPTWNHRLPAPDVDGRPAYWLSEVSDRVSSFGLLRWQTADGRWAEISFGSWNQKSVTEDILRMAAGIAFEDSPTPMPFYIRDFPAGVTLSSAELDPAGSPSGSWSALLIFGVETQNYVISVAAPLQNVSNQVIGSKSGREYVRVCTHDRTVDYCVTGMDDPHHLPPSLAAIGGAPGLLRLVHPLGTDPAGWTTDVLR